jgi:hypothetical protein
MLCAIGSCSHREEQNTCYNLGHSKAAAVSEFMAQDGADMYQAHACHTSNAQTSDMPTAYGMQKTMASAHTAYNQHGAWRYQAKKRKEIRKQLKPQ